jgi:hypothetical protein
MFWVSKQFLNSYHTTKLHFYVQTSIKTSLMLTLKASDMTDSTYVAFFEILIIQSYNFQITSMWSYFTPSNIK